MAATRDKAQLMSASEIDRTLVRLAHEILEKTEDLGRLAFIGIRRAAFRWRSAGSEDQDPGKTRSSGRVPGHQFISRRSFHCIREASAQRDGNSIFPSPARTSF